MSMYGKNLKITIFGQSHAPSIGVVIEGFKAGFEIDTKKLNAFMKRRAPGQNEYSTPRKEKDEIKFISGVINNKTCGSPICAIIENTNTISSDYKEIADIPRPAHSDFTAYMKYNGNNDVSGGGMFSGRLTAPLCIAGGLCKQYLEQQGIHIGAHISSICNITDDNFDYVKVSKNDFVDNKDFPVLNDKKGEEMKKCIADAKEMLDSVGGTVECAVVGMPAGVGGALFDGIEGKISLAVFGIPAVKGIEFGSGFKGSTFFGSQNNDPFSYENGKVVTKTNNHGGILGGISSSMPIVFNTAIKPTPSISKPQESISLKDKTNKTLIIKGRHDPCIVPRAVPCIEAATAVAIYDLLLEEV